MTPEQAANEPQFSAKKRDWIQAASAKDLHRFIHLAMIGNLNQPEYELARTALQIRLAEDSEKSVQQLTGQTDRLAAKVGDLVTISNEQKQLATKLEIQTDKLIKLTKAVIVFTVVLVFVGLIQIYLMLKEDSAAHIQHVQPGQHEQAGETNK